MVDASGGVVPVRFDADGGVVPGSPAQKYAVGGPGARASSFTWSLFIFCIVVDVLFICLLVHACTGSLGTWFRTGRNVGHWWEFIALGTCAALIVYGHRSLKLETVEVSAARSAILVRRVGVNWKKNSEQVIHLAKIADIALVQFTQQTTYSDVRRYKVAIVLTDGTRVYVLEFNDRRRAVDACKELRNYARSLPATTGFTGQWDVELTEAKMDNYAVITGGS